MNEEKIVTTIKTINVKNNIESTKTLDNLIEAKKLNIKTNY
tara:strand:+ start:1645 stop:1767 length:123 start_codon:yes stop_codon:yes gene_type:complete